MLCLRRRRYKQQQAALQSAIAADVRSRLRPHVAWAVYGIFTVCSLQEQTHFLPSLLVNGLTLLGERSLASHPPPARSPPAPGCAPP